MTDYRIPTKEMEFVLNELVEIGGLTRLARFEDATKDVVEAIIEEAGKLASEVLAPINQSGDQVGSQLDGTTVVTPPGFAEAYAQFVESDWLSLAQNPQYGGQGLPYTLHMAVSEMWNSANLSFALNPMLTSGVIEAMEAHASETLKQQYLPKLISGEWTGTMNLTEPQAGSDLSVLTTKAIPEGDHYLLTGQKIFITWGDHEMTDNVIQLVLARTPDAPPGNKGISLFLVPKYLLDDDGNPSQRNDVHTLSLEHKLGIHASPTCVMSYGDNGGAVGYLVGELYDGLSCMFKVMNHARLEVGLEGVGISERACQKAVAYAKERIQGRAPGHQDRVAIIEHSDVRRMLMLMRCLTEAARALTYVGAINYDYAAHGDGESDCKKARDRLEIFTPVIKGWCTEIAQEVTSLGIQVHGGMGYVEETGAAQYYRDARITPIYEGTNGIQALDLIGRKLIRDEGLAMGSIYDEIEEAVRQLKSTQLHELARMGEKLSDALVINREVTDAVLKNRHDPVHSGFAAFNYLMLTGTLFGAWQMARAALIASDKLETDPVFYEMKTLSSLFFMNHVLPRSRVYQESILAGSAGLMGLSAERF
ncbi:MAG: acyl-CoA dehydrogenase [Candidatus Thiodiazotropha sp.]